MRVKTIKGRRQNRRSFLEDEEKITWKLHPLFLLVGFWYLLKNEFLIFLMSCFVAIQHELAHGFSANRLGYTLNQIVLMPFGAVIDGDLSNISATDEIKVALAGPFCNFITAGIFAGLWWFFPDTYAYTDTAFYTSLTIGMVNLLPAYPLDGGRVLYALLTHIFLRKGQGQVQAKRRSLRLCKGVTLVLFLGLLALFFTLLGKGQFNLSLLIFAIFLLLGAIGNREKAVYQPLNFSCKKALKRGVEIRKVAVLEDTMIKDLLKYLVSGTYLIIEVYDKNEKRMFEITQNELSNLFQNAPSPYLKMYELYPKNPINVQD